MTTLSTQDVRALDESPTTALGRTCVLLFGVTSYAVGVGGLFALFLATFGLIPFSRGPVHIESRGLAIAFNACMIVVFGIHHAVLARPAFKARWTQIVPKAIERSIFVLSAGGLMGLILLMWQPLPAVVWSVESQGVRIAMWAVASLGFSYTLLASFAIDHFELFGLKQVFRYFRGDTTGSPAFVQRFMYRFDRHPLMAGMMIGFWSIPVMRLDQLVLTIFLTLYIIVGVSIEERDLIRAHGDGYRAYKKRVGTLVPFLGRVR